MTLSAKSLSNRRPHADTIARRMRILAMIAVATMSGISCAESAASTALRAPSLEIVVGEPSADDVASGSNDASRGSRAATTDGSAIAELTTLDGEREDVTTELPASWNEVNIPKLTFADALQRARDAQGAYVKLAVPPGAPRPSDSALQPWFKRANALIEDASRMYAAAFHAEDASREGRIDAISEAAELDMSFAMRLAQLGLETMPTTWKSDPALRVSFEDVATGPTRRWRDEARALARRCVVTAKETNVATGAARQCLALRTGTPTLTRSTGRDASLPAACAPGDPLCSASLIGW